RHHAVASQLARSKVPVRSLAPFSAIIEKWLDENAKQRGYLKVVVPDKEAEGEAIVVFHFPHQDDAFAFVMRFRSLEMPEE
ncbi:hypothetical protein, partial [Methylobacterium sp. V23]|uniref:hypothetical protein n=1 Tax=Methylobacterium sp. V23 TaxID=2044878 RepID=UPI001AECED5A